MYQVIIEDGPYTLALEVTKFMKMGWLPTGGVTISPTGKCYQAIYLPK